MITLHERMNRLAKQVPLAKEKQMELALAYQSGDVGAMHLLVESNLRLILKFATHYCRKARRYDRQIDMEELVNAGCLGLLKSLKSFDPTKGASVMWHAQSSVKGHMAKLLGMDHVMRIDLIRARNKKARADGRETIAEPIMAYMDDTPTDRSETPKPELAVVEADPEQDNRLDVERALKCLNESEAEMITSYFGLDGNEPKPSYDVKTSKTFTMALKKMGYGIGAMKKPLPLKRNNVNRTKTSNAKKESL